MDASTAASWPHDYLAAKVSPLVVNLKRLMVRPDLRAKLLRRLRNSRPDNDAKTILAIIIIVISLRAKGHLSIWAFFDFAARRPARDDAGQTRQIGIAGLSRQSLSSEDRGDAVRLPRADLEEEAAA